MKLPVIFAGHRASDGIAFAACAPTQTVLCCDGASSAELAAREFDLRVLSLEAYKPTREHWTSAHIDRVASSLLPERVSGIVVSYSSSAALEKLHNAGTLPDCFVNSMRLKQFFDNKIISKKIFRNLGLTTPNAKIIGASAEALVKAIRTLGLPLVVRKIFSSTGSGTFLIETPDDAYEMLLQNGIAQGERIILEQYVAGIPININAVVLQDFIHVYEPSVQLIGISECTSLPFGFCGNDYVTAQGLPAAIREECARQARLVGVHLQRAGFLGLYGMDFIVTPEGVCVPCEINPRFQNSTAILNWTHRGSEFSPALLHLAAFGMKIAAGKGSPRHYFSQVIVNMQREAGVSMQALDEGRYKIVAGKLVLIERTLSPLNLQNGEFLVSGSPPMPGTRIQPGASLFKIILHEAVTQNGRSITSPAVIEAIPALRHQLQIITA